MKTIIPIVVLLIAASVFSGAKSPDYPPTVSMRPVEFDRDHFVQAVLVIAIGMDDHATRLTTPVGTMPITWSDVPQAKHGYRIERSSNAGNFEKICELPAHTTKYDVGDFENGFFLYRVCPIP
jgi:hypothetical protein